MTSRALKTGLTPEAVALGLAGLPSAAHAAPSGAASVCNEAENSPRGGYTVGPGDPRPPAFLRGSQMRVGNGHGAGLANAAERSPALAPCATPPPPPPPPPPPDDGGGDGGDEPPFDPGEGGGIT